MIVAICLRPAIRRWLSRISNLNFETFRYSQISRLDELSARPLRRCGGARSGENGKDSRGEA
jgi:hypothetical protein